MTTDNLGFLVDCVSLVSILDNALLSPLSNVETMSSDNFRSIFGTPLSSHKKSQLSFMCGFSQNMAAVSQTILCGGGGTGEEGDGFGMSINGIPLICSGLDLIEACISRSLKTNYNKSTGFVADDITVSNYSVGRKRIRCCFLYILLLLA